MATAAKLVSVKPRHTPAASTDAHTTSAKPFDLNLISDPKVRAEIETQVGRVRQSLKRTAYEIVAMGHAFGIIKKQAQGFFEDICETCCGVDPRVARRMINASEFAAVRLTDHEHVLDNISAVVLYRLAGPGTPDSLVDEVVHRASSGEKLLPADLKRLTEQLKLTDAERAKAVDEAYEASKALKQAVAAQEKAELAALQHKEAAERLSSTVTHTQEQCTALMEEVESLNGTVKDLKAKLKNAPTVDHEVPTVPEGYTSIQAAIKDVEKQLRKAQEELAKAEGKKADAERQLAAIEGKRASAKASLDALTSFRQDIQALAAKYTSVFLSSLHAQDDRVKAECTRIASHLHMLGDQISPTGAKAPAKRA